MVIKVIDENHQEFNDVIYRKNSEGYFMKGSRRLHREVWKFFNGEIPAGYHIHHCDSNPANNNLDNLQCLTNSEHRRIHSAGTAPPPHKEIVCTCDYCGKEFVVHQKSGKNHFCSEQCASAYKYRSSDNQETRVCQNCGKEFTTNKYSDTKCCCVSCAQKLRFKGRSFKRICPVCGKEFETIASQNSICWQCQEFCVIRIVDLTPFFQRKIFRVP